MYFTFLCNGITICVFNIYEYFLSCIHSLQKFKVIFIKRIFNIFYVFLSIDMKTNKWIDPAMHDFLNRLDLSILLTILILISILCHTLNHRELIWVYNCAIALHHHYSKKCVNPAFVLLNQHLDIFQIW